jgi:hypothetical protein
MRRFAILLAAAAVSAAAVHSALAEGRIRLAQTSIVTNCMMTCNAQAATCQTGCVVPTPPTIPTIPATPNPNPTASTTCTLGCTSTQVACQTNCARLSPSQ